MVTLFGLQQRLRPEDAKIGKRVYRDSRPERFAVVVATRETKYGREVQVLSQKGRKSTFQPCYRYYDLDVCLARIQQLKSEVDMVESRAYAFEREQKAKGRLPG